MDDQELMAHLAAGHHGCVGDLYDRYGRQVYSLALRMLDDSAAAEDVTHDVFMKVLRHAGRFDPERGRVVTWILHLAYTTTVDLLRARRRMGPSRFDMQPVTEVDHTADTSGDAETIVLGGQVRMAMMRMHPDQRQVVELAYFGSLTQQEIANRLEVPLGTVKSRIRLGIEALRQFMMNPIRKEGDSVARLSRH